MKYVVGDTKITSDKYYIDPDGFGGVDPFKVMCQLWKTKVTIEGRIVLLLTQIFQAVLRSNLIFRD